MIFVIHICISVLIIYFQSQIQRNIVQRCARYVLSPSIYICRYCKSRLVRVYYPRPLISGGNSKPNARSPRRAHASLSWLIEILLKMVMMLTSPSMSALNLYKLSHKQDCFSSVFGDEEKQQDLNCSWPCFKWLRSERAQAKGWKSCEVCVRPQCITMY